MIVEGHTDYIVILSLFYTLSKVAKISLEESAQIYLSNTQAGCDTGSIF